MHDKHFITINKYVIMSDMHVVNGFIKALPHPFSHT